jgi:hypothetical protein
MAVDRVLFAKSVQCEAVLEHDILSPFARAASKVSHASVAATASPNPLLRQTGLEVSLDEMLSVAIVAEGLCVSPLP